MQIGSADQLFERPAHTFVGHFIGSPGMNFLPANILPGAPAGAAKLGVRPEYVTLAAANAPGAIAATITLRQDVGTYWLLTAQAGGTALRARLDIDAGPPPIGRPVWLQVQGPHTCYYDANEELVA